MNQVYAAVRQDIDPPGEDAGTSTRVPRRRAFKVARAQFLAREGRGGRRFVPFPAAVPLNKLEVVTLGQHNRGGRQHPRVDEAKEARILAILDGREITEGGFVAHRARRNEKKYHVRNLAYVSGTDLWRQEQELRQLFESIGTISELHIFVHYNNGRSRGFACLRMVGDAFALQGQMFQGRELRIDNWDRE